MAIMQADANIRGSGMKEINLNHIAGIDIAKLENGNNDFLVKIGKTFKALRINKNEIGCAITLYESKDVRNEKIEALLQPEFFVDFLGNKKAPFITRELLEHLPSICKAISILRNSELGDFYLKKQF